jgi:hypothetical protein
MYWVTYLFPFHFQKRFKIAREDINVSSACTYRYKVTDFMELRLIYFLEKSKDRMLTYMYSVIHVICYRRKILYKSRYLHMYIK